MTRKISLHEWLTNRGLTSQQADHWSDFITDSIELIDDGHALLRSPPEWESFLSGCHKENPTEPEITSGLGDRMKRLQHEAPMDSSRDKLQVGYEVPPIGDESHGIRKPKADFEIQKKFEAGYAASFVIEAKPLRIPSDMSNRYLGDEGIGCFLKRNPPYSRHVVVGMLGYAMKDHSKWAPLLSNLINTTGASTGINELSLHNGNTCQVSEHKRENLDLPLVTVTHTILNYT